MRVATILVLAALVSSCAGDVRGTPIPSRVDPSLDVEGAIYPRRGLPAGEFPYANAVRTDEGDLAFQVFDRGEGKEMRRLTLVLPRGGASDHVDATVIWYDGDGSGVAKDEATSLTGVVTTSPASVLTREGPWIVVYDLHGVRGDRPVDARGKLVLQRFDLAR